MKVFVILTAGNCGACNNLKRNPEYSRILKAVKDLEDIDSIIHIELETMRSPPVNDVPRGFIKYIGSFPAFFLFNLDEWREGLINPQADLNGDIYGMTLRSPGVLNANNEYVIRAENIVTWIINKRKKPINEIVKKNDTSLIRISNSKSVVTPNIAGDFEIVRPPNRKWS